MSEMGKLQGSVSRGWSDSLSQDSVFECYYKNKSQPSGLILPDPGQFSEEATAYRRRKAADSRQIPHHRPVIQRTKSVFNYAGISGLLGGVRVIPCGFVM